MLFPDVRDARQAEALAEAALGALTEPFETGGRIIDLGASIGVALCPQDGRTSRTS
jgi:GGDEF domain-containing protein